MLLRGCVLLALLAGAVVWAAAQAEDPEAETARLLVALRQEAEAEQLAAIERLKALYYDDIPHVVTDALVGAFAGTPAVRAAAWGALEKYNSSCFGEILNTISIAEIGTVRAVLACPHREGHVMVLGLQVSNDRKVLGPELIALMRRDPTLRTLALGAFAYEDFQNEEVIACILESLRDPAAAVRAAAAAGTGHGPHALDARLVDALFAAVTDPDPAVRRAATGRACQYRADPRLMPAMLARWREEPDEDIRQRIALALTSMTGTPEVLALLPEVFAAVRDETAQTMVHNLGVRSSPADIALLRHLADTKDDSARYEAARAKLREMEARP